MLEPIPGLFVHVHRLCLPDPPAIALLKPTPPLHHAGRAPAPQLSPPPTRPRMPCTAWACRPAMRSRSCCPPLWSTTSPCGAARRPASCSRPAAERRKTCLADERGASPRADCLGRRSQRGRGRSVGQGAARARSRAHAAHCVAGHPAWRDTAGRYARRLHRFSRPPRRRARQPSGQRQPNRVHQYRRLLPHRRHHRRAQTRAPQPRRAGVHRLGLRAVAWRAGGRRGHQRLPAVPGGRRAARVAHLAECRRRDRHPQARAVSQQGGHRQLLEAGAGPQSHRAVGRAHGAGRAGQ